MLVFTIVITITRHTHTYLLVSQLKRDKCVKSINHDEDANGDTSTVYFSGMAEELDEVVELLDLCYKCKATPHMAAHDLDTGKIVALAG